MKGIAMPSANSWKTIGLALAPLLVLIASPAYADTLIDFENLAAGTAVSNQYPGATFNGADATGAHISVGDVTGHNSSANVLINSPIANPNSGGPITITFNPAQKTVTLFASYVLFPGAPNTLRGSLTAFDQSGGLVPGASVSADVAGGMATTQLMVSSTQTNIASVTLTLGQGIFTVIDDLSFAPGAGTAPGAPVVNISAPVNGATINVSHSSLEVTGTVSGQALNPNVQVLLQALFNPPNQKAPAFTATVPLDSAGAFDGPSAFVNVPTGTYRLTVTATNQMAQSGSASVTVNNFSPALGVTPSAFQYSQVANDECQFVAYNDGTRDRALGFFPATGQVIPVDRPVLQKWQNVNNPSILHGDGTLGCPLLGATARVEPADMVGSVANTYRYKIAPFQRGSIYSVLNSQETMTIVPPTYTPKVFVDAINQLSIYALGSTPVPVNDDGGIDEVGIPVADPTFDLSVEDPTFLFQQFARPWYVARDPLGNVTEQPGNHFSIPGIPNTLEIRGGSPTLYVERIGGSLLDYRASFEFREANCQGPGTGVCNVPVPGDRTPTIWESAGCIVNPTTQAFNCAINHPHVQAFTAQTNTPVYTAAPGVPNYNNYCFTGTDVWLAAGIAIQQETEWSAIPNKPGPNTDTGVGDFVDIQALGWVIASNKSSADFPATHEHMQGSADTDIVLGTALGCVGGSLLPITTVPGCALGAFGGYQYGGNGGGLWSDWGIHVRPLALAIPDPNAPWVITPASGTLPPYWNLLAANGDPTLQGTDHAPGIDIEMEWEEFWQHTWVSVAGTTIPIGSLVFANGRWIIDCGHPPDHSEIHPPNTLMFAETKPQPANKTFANGVGTTAQMWVNEFYMGGPFQAQVWPPPRPSPTSKMDTDLNTWAPAGQPRTTNPDGSITFSFAPSSNSFGQLPPATPAIAQATVVRRHNGLLLQVEGPPTGHDVNDTGQDVYPDDDTDSALGPISNLYATWTVGWK